MENCIYLNTKNAILAGAKDTNSHTANLEGDIFQKKKKRIQFTSEQATTEKVQRKYINICLNNKKKKIQIDTGSYLTKINAETWKK